MSQRTFVAAGEADQPGRVFAEIGHRRCCLRMQDKILFAAWLARGREAGYFGARNFMRVIRRQRFW